MSREAFLGSGGFTGLKRHQDAEYTERMKRKGYQLLFEPSVKCWLVNAENARTLLYKMFFDGAGYAVKVGPFRALLLPGIGILNFARIGLRNLWWRRDMFSVLLFLPTVCVCLVWVAGGIIEIAGLVSSEPVATDQVESSPRNGQSE